MPETVPSTNTFDALTRSYTEDVLIDNVMRGTPLWEQLKRNMKPVSGRAWEPLIEYSYEDGEWYTTGSQVGSPTTASTDIATRASYTLKWYRRKILLDAQYTDLQGNMAIVDLLRAYIKSATNAAGRNLSTALFSTVSNAVTPLTSAALDTGAYGGLNPATSGYEHWHAHCMYGEDTFATAVSPSINNVGKVIQSIQTTCGPEAKADIGICAESYWDTLAAQVTANDQLVAKMANADNLMVKLGFTSLWIDNVPIVSDRDCGGTAWVPAQSTRSAAAGYEMFLIPFKYLKFAYFPGRSFKFDPDGWRRPVDYDRYVNYLYVWGEIGTNQRRALGRIQNVDIAQDVSDYKLGTMHLPG